MAAFRILGIHHLGLASGDPSKTIAFFQLLGLEVSGTDSVESQLTEVTFLHFNSGPSSSQLEVLEPLKGQGPVQKYLTHHPRGGIHHLALRVDDLRLVLSHLQTQGVRLIDETPRPGAHATLVAFVHPESTGGILVELVQ